MKISTVIVTFNRKNDFLRCLKAVKNQTKKIDNVVIVNNASTDDTLPALLKELQLPENFNIKSDCLVELVSGIFIVNKSCNTGGAGGFHDGLMYAHQELKSDYYWLMDDDGFPSDNCLEQLIVEASNYDYIMPTSININDFEQLSWPTRMVNGKKTIYYSELKDSWGKFMNFVTPFNGVLLSKKCVDEVGYINKDFFIWGDDYEHYFRCLKNNISPTTLLDAKFYHPAQKVAMKKLFFGFFSIAYSESPLRMVCLARNWTYIYSNYGKIYMIPIKWIMYWWFFIITRHFDIKGWKLYKASVKDGLKGNFTRHFEYLK